MIASAVAAHNDCVALANENGISAAVIVICIAPGSGTQSDDAAMHSAG